MQDTFGYALACLFFVVVFWPVWQISVFLPVIDLYVYKYSTAVTITYLWPSLLVEHRLSTTPRHRTLFWAAVVIPDQLVHCCFSSAWVSRLQLLRGRPLFLFPDGFQVRAWSVVLDAGFLRVCPIQPHFLHSVCLATGSCSSHSRRSSFQILLWQYLLIYSPASTCVWASRAVLWCHLIVFHSINLCMFCDIISCFPQHQLYVCACMAILWCHFGMYFSRSTCVCSCTEVLWYHVIVFFLSIDHKNSKTDSPCAASAPVLGLQGSTLVGVVEINYTYSVMWRVSIAWSWLCVCVCVY